MKIELMKQIECPVTRISVMLDFLAEYGGTIQNIKSVGLTWGASGEESRVNRAYLDAGENIQLLKNEILQTVQHLTPIVADRAKVSQKLATKSINQIRLAGF